MDQPATAARVTDAFPASPVVELRQYTLKPGQRDTLMDLFEREFVAGQRGVGIRLHGEFRDARDPDRFVWLRGFASLEDRPRALGAFYSGAVWKARRDAANATMIDSDDVLLLQPLESGGFTLAGRTGALIVATVCLLREPVDDAFTRFFAQRVKPALDAAGAAPFGMLRTLYAENAFPALPVREGVHAFAWFTAHESRAECDRQAARLARSEDWSEVRDALDAHLAAPPVVLELEPTRGTLRRNGSPPVHRAE